MSYRKHLFYIPIALCGLFLSASPALGQWAPIANAIIENPLGTNCAMRYQNGLLWVASQTLRVSTDLGVTFTSITPPAPIEIAHLDFIDRQHGLVGNMRSIFVTSDGGNSWTPVYVATSAEVWCAILLGSTNDILVGDGYPGKIRVTHDGGAHWSDHALGDFPSCAVYKPKTRSVFAFAGDLANGAHIWSSHDLGDSWQMSSGVVDFDSWSFQVDDCDEKRIYVSNEDDAVPTDNISQLFVSADAGGTWAKPVGFGLPFFCGSVALSSGAIFCQTTSSGTFRSSDRGLNWKSIGGPSHVIDSRLIESVDDNILFAVDDQGTLYKTINSGGDSLIARSGLGKDVLWLASIAPVLDQTNCTSSDSVISFGFLGCTTSARLLLVSLLDSLGNTSEDVHLVDTATLPRTIGENDFLHLRYSLPQGSSERLSLHFNYIVGTTTHDTTISIIARNSIDYAATTLADGTLTPKPGDDVNIPIRIALPASAQNLAGVTDLTYSLDYHSDAIDIQPAQLLGRITPPAGWSIQTASIIKDHLTATAHNDHAMVLSAPLDLGSVNFVAFMSGKKHCLVTMGDLSVVTSEKTYRFCFAAEGDYVADVAVVGASVANTSMPVNRLVVFPNPARGGAGFHAECELSAPAQLGWSLIDVLGRTLYRHDRERWSAGTHSFDLPTNDLAAGSYFLRLQVGEYVRSQRLVLQR